ncbi:MAG: signal peptidase I [Saccharofermentanales bacterium]
MKSEETEEKKNKRLDFSKVIPSRVRREHRMIIKMLHYDDDGQAIVFFKKVPGTRRRPMKKSTRGFEESMDEDEIVDGRLSGDKESKRDEIFKEVIDWIKHIVIAAAIGLLLVFFVVQRNEVIGSSMEPNLYENDQLLVQKVSKLFKNGIEYGDIITVNALDLDGHIGDKNIIKRVIGIPGDSIEIKDGKVYRNGEMLEEAYLQEDNTGERTAEYSKVTLDKDEYYVLGDHRSVSLDSRTFGPITKDRIIGEVLIRFFPLDEFGRP